MKEIGSYEAKTHLPQLLSQVANGERFTITKHGVPIALLIPLEQNTRPNVKNTIANIKHLQKKSSLGNITIKQLIEEGRRF